MMSSGFEMLDVQSEVTVIFLDPSFYESISSELMEVRFALYTLAGFSSSVGGGVMFNFGTLIFLILLIPFCISVIPSSSISIF